jgi:O-antigen ligase/tetratricopeptide (TPR) repeat protein
VVSTVASVSPHTSWRGAPESCAGLQTVLGYAALYFGVRVYCLSLDDGRRLLVAAVVGAASASAYALLQAARLDPIDWDRTSKFAEVTRPFGSLGHANLLGAFLAMAAPLAGAFALRAADRRRWIAVAALGATVGAAALATAAGLSRAAWLATALGAVVLTVGWWTGGARRAAAGLTAAAALALVGGAAWALFAGRGGWGGAVAERLTHWHDREGRGPIWQAAWNLFRARPMRGWGLDTFQLVFGVKRPPDYGRVEWDASPTRAHNEPLHLLATQGLLGLTAAAVFAVGVARAAVGAWRRSVKNRPLLAAVFAALVAFVVQGFFGFTVIGVGSLAVTCAAVVSLGGRAGGVSPPVRVLNQGAYALRSPEWVGLPLGSGLAASAFAINVGMGGAVAGVVFAAATTCGLIAVLRTEGAAPRAADSRVAPPSAWRRLTQGAVGLAAAATVYVGAIRPFEAAVACGDGDAHASEPTVALAAYACAADLDPDDARLWVKRSGAAVAAARLAAAPDEQNALYAEAIAALDRAASLEPADAYVAANRGRLLGEMAVQNLARPADAEAAWDAALAADPNNAAFLSEAARTALAVGDRPRARRLAERGRALYPDYGQWNVHLGAAAFADGRLPEAAEALDAGLRGQWYGDEEGVAHGFAIFAAVCLRLGRAEQAAQVAGESARHDARWPTPWRLRGRAEESLGRVAAARDAYRQLLQLSPDDADARAALQRLSPPAGAP